MTIVYAVINNKGGTGKTTTAVTLADLTARANHDVPVCLVDLDPQGHAATFLGLDQEVNGRCIGKVLKDRSTLRANIINGSAPDRERPNLFLMPSSRDLDVSLEELVALATVSARRGSGPKLNTILADVLAPAIPEVRLHLHRLPPKLGYPDNGRLQLRRLRHCAQRHALCRLSGSAGTHRPSCQSASGRP